MSAKYPIVAVTGSSGAGTSSVRPVFAALFEEVGLRAGYVDGDSFHALDRAQMRAALDRARIRGENFSHFGPAANHFDRLQRLFRQFAETGTGEVRRYLHTEVEAEEAGQPAGTFTPWEPLAPDIDLLFYEGLHGGLVAGDIDVAAHVDLLIGVTPTVNLEWIQKLVRDTQDRGYEPQEVTQVILRRMPDYITYITPQFSRTDVNFQRVPLVDTSNPFLVREIPRPEESLVVIHFNEGSRAPQDLDALCDQLPGSFISAAGTLVVPGSFMQEAVRLTLRPAVVDLAERRRGALGLERRAS